MKHVLLATTALAMSASVAAADTTMSASAKLSYGNYGTGTVAGAKDQSWGQNADFNIGMSGESGGISYSAGLEIDEDGSPSAGPITMSSGGISLTYDANDIGGLVSTGADGEDDNTGDVKIAFSGGGITASYTSDTETEDTDMHVGYSANGLTLGLQVEDNDGAKGGKAVNTISIGYVVGDLTLKYSQNDKSKQEYDVSVAYALGTGATVTIASDENEANSVGIAGSVGDLAVTARFEQDGKSAGDSSENEISVGYALGDTKISVAYDTGQKGKYGDEAETTIVVDHGIGGIALQLKANDQNEMEVSAAFTF